jgi:taurine dioxygenase
MHGSPSEASVVARELRMVPLSPALGAEILDVDTSRVLDAATIAAIRSAWLAHGVLLFRGQQLDDLEQVRFGEYFGELHHRLHDYESGRAHPGIMYVTNERKDGKYVGALPDGEMYFHSDMCYLEVPCMGSILYAIDVPSQGGDTLFANMYRAYEALPDEWKQRIEGLRAINSYEPGSSDYALTRMQHARSPSARWHEQPVVRTHPETGRKALYVNRLMTESIVGVSPEESERILTYLFAHEEQPSFVYEHRWASGDLVMWDNRCTLHARRDFSSRELRKLRRVTIKGDKPY